MSNSSYLEATDDEATCVCVCTGEGGLKVNGCIMKKRKSFYCKGTPDTPDHSHCIIESGLLKGDHNRYAKGKITMCACSSCTISRKISSAL